MDGYTITPNGAEVLATIEQDGVRYAARMAGGTGFVAWEGRPPAIEGENFVAEPQSFWFKIRRLVPTEEDRFYQLSDDAFRQLADEYNDGIKAATQTTDGRWFVQTETPLLGFTGWGGKVREYVAEPLEAQLQVEPDRSQDPTQR